MIFWLWKTLEINQMVGANATTHDDTMTPEFTSKY